MSISSVNLSIKIEYSYYGNSNINSSFSDRRDTPIARAAYGCHEQQCGNGQPQQFVFDGPLQSHPSAVSLGRYILSL